MSSPRPLLFALLTACATTSPSARPSFTVDAPPAPGEPVGLRGFVTEYLTSVVSHDWGRALTYYDPANRAEQAEMGIGDAQYLAEGMRIIAYREIDPPPDAPRVDHATRLDQIQRIIVERVEPGRITLVHGIAVLTTGRRYRMILYVRRTPDGFTLSPPVG